MKEKGIRIKKRERKKKKASRRKYPEETMKYTNHADNLTGSKRHWSL